MTCGPTSSTASRSALVVLAFSLLGLVALPDEAHAQADRISQGGTAGIGLGGGTITSGITGKYYLSRETAIQGFLGSWRGFAFSFSGDFVYEFADFLNEPEGRLFFGLGGGAGFAQSYGLEPASFLVLNGVVELGWHFKEVPIELILDVRPTFALGPPVRFYGRFAGFDPFGAGLAFRWFFP